MYKLLIVEDEKSTRDGLRDCVDWQSYDIEVIGEMPNGKEALAFLLDNPIDIVLTDVVMPLMDGIELVRQIRQRNISAKVVFISGYWDMPYLKSAFELDAVDYILKPIKLTELEMVIQKVIGICNREREEKKTIQEMRDKLAASMPVLREQFVAELLTGGTQEKDAVEQRAHFLEIPFIDDGYYTVLTVEINAVAEDGFAKNIEANEMQRMIIKDVIESTFKAEYRLFCVMMKEKYINIIVNSQISISYNEVSAIAQRIQDSVYDAIDIQLSIGIGEEVRSIGYLNRSYQKSVRALEQGYFLGAGEIIHYKDIDFESNVPDYYPYQIQEELFNAIRLGKKHKVRVLAQQFFKEMQDYSGMSIEYVQTICLEFIILAEKLLLESNDIKLNIGKRKDLWKRIFRLKSLKQTEEWMCNQLCNMANEIANIQNQRTKGIIGRIKKLIHERCNDDITIQVLAEEFYLTPNYISMLFKKETGKNFKEYLTKVRLDKAKTLMEDTSLKLYEIAQFVGYNDPDYFTKVFKKYTGATPTEYRRRLS